ncbi:hypothetical protein SAY87_024789 [Trapa incisa]|uniref:Molybdenum cofactor sulfurase n=1 Tax=Trapa incisa TaxID=236973 RepID=A0AAN7J8X7_9MYRT|nr:hypothetical protein SAY87_024789 [Trapa incisa]
MSSRCTGEASAGVCFHGCSPFFTHPSEEKPPTIAATFRSDFAASVASSLNPTSSFTNHETLPSLHESFSGFATAFPQFSDTERADRIRDREYPHLSSAGHVCLDYSTGHGLFSYSQQCINCGSTASAPSSSSSHTPSELIISTTTGFFEISYKPVVLGAQLAHGGPESEMEASARKRITRFMNLSEDDYTVVFVSNQTSAFRIVADSYPFQSHRNLLTVYDHESEAVESMIKSSTKRGAKVKSTEFSWPNLKIYAEKLKNLLVGKGSRRKSSKMKGLFVFPLQSRISGSLYSYSWMAMARENGWHVLLDACSIGPKDMETLGLSLFKPEFLVCSFYKVFGDNPSGFACLFVKKSSASILKSSSDACTSTIGVASLVPSLAMAREGTMPLPKIVEVEEMKAGPEIQFRGLDHADVLGRILINSRGRYLINWLVNALLRLRHPDSVEEDSPHRSLVRIYGPKVMFERGPAVAFNVFDWKGERIDPKLVQKLADRFSITLSYGFLRHVWFRASGEKSDEGREEEEEDGAGRGGRSPRRVCVVTAAVGFLTNFEDVYRVWAFVSRFLDADFVEKGRWRYTALNQQMVEV